MKAILRVVQQDRTNMRGRFTISYVNIATFCIIAILSPRGGCYWMKKKAIQ